MRLEHGEGPLSVAGAHVGARRMVRGQVAAVAVRVLEADGEEGRSAGRRDHRSVEPCRVHLLHESPPSAILADFADRDHGDAVAEKLPEVVADDVEFAVVPAFKQVGLAALLAAEGAVSLQRQEDARADTAGPDDEVVAPGHERPRSHSGCRPTWWVAVSMVAVSNASRWSCSRVIGYSVVSGPEQPHAQRRLLAGAGVAEQTDPARGQDLAHTEGHRHRRHQLVGAAEGSLGERDDCLDVVLLNACGRAPELVHREGAERVAAGLVVGDVAVLAPTPVDQVSRRLQEVGPDLRQSGRVSAG